MPRAKEGNIYDLVERAAARRDVPRLELWESVLSALIGKKFSAVEPQYFRTARPC